MKDRILRFSAMLLVVWYCLSVIGFDVHTCTASGRSFITTFVSGLSCKDIHPEHDCCGECNKGGCCHHEEARHAILADSCCSNDYLSLSITGDSSGEKYRTSTVSESCMYTVVDKDACRILSAYEFRTFLMPDSRQIFLGDTRPLFNIWRL